MVFLNLANSYSMVSYSKLCSEDGNSFLEAPKKKVNKEIRDRWLKSTTVI